MKVSTKQWLGYALISIGLLASCEEREMTNDKEAIDEELPKLSIISPTEPAEVWLITPLEVEASDNQGVAKVIFYLDEKMLGEDSEAPYLLDLDTRQYEDGIYTFKAKAFDEAGNEQEAIQTIEILNKLVQINVGENHLGSDWAPDQAWVLVTDVEGNAIDYRSLANGQTIVINRPEGFEADKINVIIVNNVFFGEGNKSLLIDQYNNVHPNVWNLDRNSEKESLGTARVSYFVPTNYSSYLNGNNISSSLSYDNNVQNGSIRESNLKISQEPASVYVSIDDQDGIELPRFALIEDIKVNSSYDLDSEDFQEMELWQTITVPKNDFLALSVYGSSKNGNQFNIYSNVGSFVGESVSSYVSEPTFQNFSFDLRFSSNSKSYNVLSKGKPQSQYSFPDQELEITDRTSDHFSATVSSENPVTYGMVQYGSWYDVEGYQHIAVWNIYTDLDDTLNVKQVALPAEIESQYPELEEHRPDYVFTELATYKNMPSLQNYLEWFNDPNKENAEYEKMTFFSGYSNGRVARQPHHIKPSTRGQLPNAGAQ